MCHGVAGELVPATCEGTQFIPGNRVVVFWGTFSRVKGCETTSSDFLVCFVQHAIGLVQILLLVVKLSGAGMVLERSFVTQVADCRRAFEEVALICENSGCFLDD